MRRKYSTTDCHGPPERLRMHLISSKSSWQYIATSEWVHQSISIIDIYQSIINCLNNYRNLVINDANLKYIQKHYITDTKNYFYIVPFFSTAPNHDLLSFITALILSSCSVSQMEGPTSAHHCIARECGWASQTWVLLHNLAKIESPLFRFEPFQVHSPLFWQICLFLFSLFAGVVGKQSESIQYVRQWSCCSWKTWNKKISEGSSNKTAQLEVSQPFRLKIGVAKQRSWSAFLY